jgi:hypothetical protein
MLPLSNALTCELRLGSILSATQWPSVNCNPLMFVGVNKRQLLCVTS